MTTTWRDKKRPASFRGVNFYVNGQNSQVGRRTVDHAFPLRDQPYTEDMGRKPQVFSFDAFVLGPRYDIERDALLKACSQVGPGVLVHPDSGTLKVICQSCACSESEEEGGIARFSLTFREAGTRDFPAKATDFKDQVGGIIDNSIKTVKGVFAEIFSLVGPAWIKAAAVGDFKAALGMMQSVVKVMPSPFSPQAVAQVTATINKALKRAEDIVNKGPGAIAEELEKSLTDLAKRYAEDKKKDIVDITDELIKFGTDRQKYGQRLEETEPTTEGTQTEANNRNAIKELMQKMAISTGIKTALNAEYYSYEDAIITRDRLLGGVDILMEYSNNSTEYQALRQLYVNTYEGFKLLGSDLNHVVDIPVPIDSASSLTLAYDLYGDLDRADEIANKNTVANPLFPPSGDTLKVLNG